MDKPLQKEHKKHIKSAKKTNKQTQETQDINVTISVHITSVRNKVQLEIGTRCRDGENVLWCRSYIVWYTKPQLWVGALY